MSISEIFTNFIKNWSSKEELYMKLGTVSEINEDEFTFTFTPIDQKSKVLDVRMKTIANNALESFVIVPKEGTKVVVGFHSNEVAQCLVASESDKILINTETIESISKNKTDTIQELYKIICDDVQVTSNSFVFNGGNFEGMVKIVDLTSKLNKLVDEVNALKTKYNSHVHLKIPPLTGVLTGPTLQQGIDATSFSKSDYEDTKIKH